MYYAVLGGPASGKGTRSKILCEELNIPHVSTGDLLRKRGETDPVIREKLEKGHLISDEITTELLYERLTQEDCANGCVIDGYPRTLNQAHLLDNILAKLGKKLAASIELLVPDEVIFNRILGRKECPLCGKSYGFGIHPKVDNTCDNCNSTLVRRSDDTKETLKTRIEIYKEKSNPIIKYYDEKGLLVKVDASDNPERILKVINC